MPRRPFFYIRDHPDAAFNGVFDHLPDLGGKGVVTRHRTEAAAYAAKTEHEAKASAPKGAWAVFVGWEPGVYRTAAEAQAQTFKYKGSRSRFFPPSQGKWANIYARSGRYGPAVTDYDTNPHVQYFVHRAPGAPDSYDRTNPAPYNAYTVEVTEGAQDICIIFVHVSDPLMKPVTFQQPRGESTVAHYVKHVALKLKCTPDIAAPAGTVVTFGNRRLFDAACESKRFAKYGYHVAYIAVADPNRREAEPSKRETDPNKREAEPNKA